MRADLPGARPGSPRPSPQAPANMYRPWREDPRPVWRVTGTWGTLQGYLDGEGQGLLLKTLDATGMVRCPTVDTVGYGRLTLSLAVKAGDREAAEQATARIVTVAYHAAGLGSLGMTLALTAEAHPTANRHGTGE